MIVEVLESGLLTTVQDAGRPGFESEGVPRGGAADLLSYRVANRLAGNPDDVPALEMTLVGGAFRFQGPTWAGIAGADFDASCERADGAAVPVAPWSTTAVEAGDVIRFGATRGGARAYLALSGGLAIPHVLGSASTHLPSGLGGYRGRALRRGDRLRVRGHDSRRAVGFVPDAGSLSHWVSRRSLRVVRGPQADWFPSGSFHGLSAGEFRVEETSDRTGIRLSGPWPTQLESRSLWTEGVLPGQVQLTPDGKGIVLGVDGPTTGGYPKIASVIVCDLPALGQLRPRDRVRFEPIGLREAGRAIRELQRAFER